MAGDMESTVIELRRRLLDQKLPIARRFRALISLRNLTGAGPRDALIAALDDPSCLLAHEAAFALGQMQDVAAIPALRHVLLSESYHAMVRHEAAESLGAIGEPECESLLRGRLDDAAPEVRETCQLALRRIQQAPGGAQAGAGGGATGDGRPTGAAPNGHVPAGPAAEGRAHGGVGGDASGATHLAGESPANGGLPGGERAERSPFLSVDPAPAAGASLSTGQLRERLLADGEDMYERYSALFALRNRGTADAVAAIVAALAAGSALLRHEVAYVLGQLQDRAAAAALAGVLADQWEHPMVRHEAAEALGSIADEESVALLQKFQADPEPIVAQSCDVALDMIEFERQPGAFEYADLAPASAVVALA